MPPVVIERGRAALRATAGAALLALALAAAVAPSSAQATSRDIPRTPDGKPDLQGNWSNATITPIQRPEAQGPVLTPAQVAAIEGARQEHIEEEAAPSAPDREAPPVGGDGSTGAAGGTGGYNYFYIDAGDRVARWDGEPRSSLVTFPADGRIPPITPQGRRARTAAFAVRRAGGEFANPESRPLGERCIMSFGSNAGPPMLPNYFYNNNYTIVQTPDHVMIMTEMVHDVRVIPIGEKPVVPADHRPWMGVSWGRWEGDTLVVQTTNIHPEQLLWIAYVFPGGSENMTVTERFTLADERTIHYEFRVDDPDFYTAPWGGQVPFNRLDERVYEYACHEANYALFNILSGARAEERREAGGGSDR
ncbi:MAG: hypothetical protein R3195_02175 [Gemmatimonadota bacterium]|nr:hypothetical protein [Gemmatimonadota bacterium]